MTQPDPPSPFAPPDAPPPFAPPDAARAPQAPPTAYAAPAWAPAPSAWAPQPWAQSAPWTPPPAPPPPRRGSTHVIAVVALVAGALALLFSLVTLLVMLVGSGTFDTYTLTGTAPQVVAGEPYSGAQLADEVTRVIEADGGDVANLDCPDTPRVDYDAVTTCIGTVDDWDEKITVDFQDGEGHFVLTEEDAG